MKRGDIMQPSHPRENLPSLEEGTIPLSWSSLQKTAIAFIVAVVVSFAGSTFVQMADTRDRTIRLEALATYRFDRYERRLVEMERQLDEIQATLSKAPWSQQPR